MTKPLPNPPRKIPSWSESNELSLLNAVLEIANEPTESYDPRINLFDRINKNMKKSLTDREILDKIKELRKRFKKRCRKRAFGKKAVKKTRAFAIGEKIWGKGFEMEIERQREKRKKKKMMNEKNAKSLKVNPQEAPSPNPKQGHEPTKKRNGAEPNGNCQPAGKKQKVKGSCFTCGNVGHVARDCSEKKIAEQLTKQQESKDISKGSVELRFETGTTHKELSAESGLASSQPGSLQLTSEQTKQTDEVCNSSGPAAYHLTSKKEVEGDSSPQSIAHRPSSEQRMKFNNSQCGGDNQHTSEQTKQRDEVRESSNPVAQDHISSQSVVTNQPSSEQNNLQCDDKQHMSEQIKQRDEMHGGSQPVAPDGVSSQSIDHQPSSEQKRYKVENSHRGDNQHTSEQRNKAPSSFKSGAYQYTSNQKKPSNRFRLSSHQLSLHHWNREPLIPQPPRWGPYHPIATPPSFPPYPVPYQYPAPPPPYRRSPPPGSMNYCYYPGYPRF